MKNPVGRPVYVLLGKTAIQNSMSLLEEIIKRSNFIKYESSGELSRGRKARYEYKPSDKFWFENSKSRALQLLKRAEIDGAIPATTDKHGVPIPYLEDYESNDDWSKVLPTVILSTSPRGALLKVNNLTFLKV